MLEALSDRHARRRRRAKAWGARLALYGLTVVTDAMPPRIRFGHWQRALGMLAVAGGPPSIRRDSPAPEVMRLPTPRVENPDVRCLIVAGALDSGGVENVVASLARGLPNHGIQVEVACSLAGRVANALADEGVRVTVVDDQGLQQLVSSIAPDVIQLHRPNLAHLRGVARNPERATCVFHAMETYLDASTWQALGQLTRASGVSVAVSDSVRAFFTERLGKADIRVVVNGVAATAVEPPNRATARARVATAIGCDIEDRDILVVSLQRFSDQKNAAGLVDSFLLASEQNPRLRLVIAGGTDSWLEVRRAAVLRESHPSGDRVHLLGDSDPAVILAAGDVFALDSFSEGGPLSAIEAVAAGLPIVMSDVGFARRLAAEACVRAVVVPRANRSHSQRDIARQRRRRHQSNREDFAEALVEVAREPDGPRAARIPSSFHEAAMVRAHAEVLREVACRSRALPTSGEGPDLQ